MLDIGLDAGPVSLSIKTSTIANKVHATFVFHNEHDSSSQ